MTSTARQPFSAAQFALSLLAGLFLWLGAVGFVFLGLTQGVFESWDAALPFLLMAAGNGLAGALLFPSAYYALMRLQARQPRAFLRLSPFALIWLWPWALLLGFFALRVQVLTLLLLPPLHLAAVGLPIWWLARIGERDLPSGSPQRRWGVFGSGLALGPLLILIAEVLALVVFGFFAVLVIASQPDLVAELQDLAARLTALESDPEAVLDALAPFLARPGVIFAILLFGAGIVPLIEEALKPVGVWLLAGKDLSPASGFAAGVLSGAGYALFESLSLTSASEAWAPVVVARVGTALIHIFTTGMTGWALALAWRKKQYLLLGGVYLFAVLIHGLWNGFTLATTLNEFNSADLGWLTVAGQLGPFVMVALALACFGGLIAANHALRRQTQAETAAQRDLTEL